MADDAWYHRPLWSSIVGGLLTLVLIGAGGAIANYFTKGGLVRFLGGTTPETLVADLDNLRGDEWAQVVLADLAGGASLPNKQDVLDEVQRILAELAQARNS